MKRVIIALRMLAVLTLITGVAYPALMLAAGKILFPVQAGGSLVSRDEKVVGSALLAQGFKGPGYFHPRPSAVEYATVPSGASNLSPASKALMEAVEGRRAAGEEGQGREMLFTSGSGLDPDITLESARAQIPRIMQARGLDRSALEGLVETMTLKRLLGILGQERVNVLRLNLALDEMTRK